MRRSVADIVGHHDGARFFRGAQILWSGNEVAMGDGGEVLRIDRLVHIDGPDGPAWWVLAASLVVIATYLMAQWLWPREPARIKLHPAE